MNLNTLASDARFYMCKEGSDEFIEIGEVKEINLTEPDFSSDETWMDLFNQCYEITLPVQFPKYSRKRFKKLLMSRGMPRNMAEDVCNIIGSSRGRLSYGESAVFGLLFGVFGGADLNHQSDKEEV